MLKYLAQICAHSLFQIFKKEYSEIVAKYFAYSLFKLEKKEYLQILKYRAQFSYLFRF